MKLTASILLLFIFLKTFAQGQQRVSLSSKLEGTAKKVDSLSARISTLPDSLLPSFQKLDSIKDGFNKEAFALKDEYHKSIGSIDIESNKLNHKIDSLSKLNLPTKKYTGRLDSLNQLRQRKTAEFNSKVESLKSKTTGKLNSLDLPPQYKEPIQQLTSKVDGFGLNSDFGKIPEIEIPGFTMPKLDGIGDIGKIGDVGDLGKVGTDLNLPKIETPVGDIGQVSEEPFG